MSGETSRDVGLSLKEEMQREMFLPLDRIIQEIEIRFEQLCVLATKYSCLITTNMLIKNFECEESNFVDIDEQQFYIERNRFQNFISTPSLQEFGNTKKTVKNLLNS